MPILKGYKANLDTIIRAAKNGDLTLIECVDNVTGAPVIVLAAVEVYAAKSGDVCYVFKPLAKMFDGDPYKEVEPTCLKEQS